MMTARVPHSSAAAVPLSQNTAPVIEYRCLFTHDLRRKSKRWQDGFLKYHTFNRRIMVYDIPRNFIGDTHFTQGQEPQEGDELDLDKGGVLVQVADPVGRTDTDLTELLDSRGRKSPRKDASSPANGQSPLPSRAFPRPSKFGPSQVQKHKSLNALLGTPKGRIGKAVVPTKSPFEIRHAGQENHHWQEGPSPKRQKTLNTATRISDGTSARPKTDATVLPGKPTRANAPAQYQTPAHKQSREPVVIDLCSDDPDMGIADSPVTGMTPGLTPSAHSSKRPGVPQIANAVKTGPGPDGHHGTNDQTKTLEAQKRVSPPVITSNRVTDVANVDANAGRPNRTSSTESDPHPRKGTALRLVSNAPRRMLVCQQQLSKSAQPLPVQEASKERSVAARTEHKLDDGAGVTSFRDRIGSRIARKARIESSGSQQSSPHKADVLPKSSDAFEIMNLPGERAAARAGVVGQFQDGRDHPSTSRDELAAIVPATDIPTDLTPQPQEPAPRQVVRRAGDPIRKSKNTTRATAEASPPEVVPKIIQTIRAQQVSRAETPPVEGAKPPPAQHEDRPGRPAKRLKGPQKSAPVLELNKTVDPLDNTVLNRPFRSISKTTEKAVKPQKKDEAKGPWSREAFDLFDWRPPDRDEDFKKITDQNVRDKNNASVVRDRVAV